MIFFAVAVSKLLRKLALTLIGNISENYTVLARGRFEPDDFALVLSGDGYIASLAEGNNGVAYFPRGGDNANLIASLEGPSACAFGRTTHDCHILYVTTTG